MNNIDEVAIIYMSCDKYSDLWSEYFKLFRRNWPDCPFRIYILSNTVVCTVPGVVPLAIGPDLSWSDNLAAAVDRVGAKYVLLLLDDFFIVAPVNTGFLLENISWALQEEVDCLRFSPCEPKPSRWINKYLGHVAPGALYRTSTRFPLWKSSALKSILKQGESAWEFELAGSERSDLFNGFYVVMREIFEFENCVIKGRWDPSAVRKVQSLGVKLDLAKRRSMTLRERLMERLFILRSFILNLAPQASRRKLRKAVMTCLGGRR
ncbi:MAG: hypothetical protein QM760_13680 [Nibricoccus sp.]